MCVYDLRCAWYSCCNSAILRRHLLCNTMLIRHLAHPRSSVMHIAHWCTLRFTHACQVHTKKCVEIMCKCVRVVSWALCRNSSCVCHGWCAWLPCCNSAILRHDVVCILFIHIVAPCTLHVDEYCSSHVRVSCIVEKRVENMTSFFFAYNMPRCCQIHCSLPSINSVIDFITSSVVNSSRL